MLGHLKNAFSTILMVLLFAMVIPNILKYIRVSLKLSLLLQIYRQLLTCLNFTYIVSLIRKVGFKNLDFLIANGNTIGKIPKTIIVIDKIDEAVEMAKYLR